MIGKTCWYPLTTHSFLVRGVATALQWQARFTKRRTRVPYNPPELAGRMPLTTSFVWLLRKCCSNTRSSSTTTQVRVRCWRCRGYSWSRRTPRLIFPFERIPFLERISLFGATDYYIQVDPSGVLPRHGRGNATAFTGMTWTGFRPSDDEGGSVFVAIC